MNTRKNKLFFSIMAFTALCATQANADLTTLTIDTNHNTPITFNTDALIINHGVTVSTNSGNSIEVDGVTNNGIITNNGTISSGGYYSLELKNGSALSEINNSGEIQSYVNIDHSSVTTVNNSGTLVYGITLSHSNIDELNNSGTLNQYLQVDLSSTIGTINNSTAGKITNSLFIAGSSSVDTINNAGFIRNIAPQNNVEVGAINNNAGGEIQLITLGNASSISNLNNNSGATIDTISISNGGAITTINNSGTLTGSFFSGPAIDVQSGSVSQIINSGTITGSNGTAINYNNTNDNILTLNRGSKINGLIDFGTGTGNVVNVGAGANSDTIYKFNGDFNLNSPNDPNLLVVQNNGTLAVLTKSSLADGTTENAVRSSIDIGNLLSAHLTRFRANFTNSDSASLEDEDPVQLALNNKNSRSDANSFRMNSNKSQTFYWSEAFGSHEDRASYKSAPSSDTSLGELLFGADKAIGSNQRIGGFIGGLKGSSDINDGSTIDSKGIFFGGYFSKNQRPYFTDFSLIVGLLDNNYVNSSTSKTSYNSGFFTPSVTVGKKLNFIPASISATLRYTGQWIDGYSETVESSVINTDSRYLNSISGRLEIRSDNKTVKIGSGRLGANIRTGLEANRAVGNQKVNVTALDQNISFSPDSRDYNIDGFVGVNSSYDLKDNVRIYTDIEASKGITKSVSNNNLGLFGKVGVKWNF